MGHTLQCAPACSGCGGRPAYATTAALEHDVYGHFEITDAVCRACAELPQDLEDLDVILALVALVLEERALDVA